MSCGLIGVRRGDQHFAEVAFDMVLLRVAHAAMRHHRAFAGAVAGLGGEVFRGVGVGAGILAAVVEPRRLAASADSAASSSTQCFRERMLDRLVLADRPAEHNALPRIARRAREGDAADAHRLGGDQDALRVQPVQQHAEPFALLADAVLLPALPCPSKNTMFEIDRVAAHLVDQPHLGMRAVELRVEQRHPVDAPLHLLAAAWCG